MNSFARFYIQMYIRTLKILMMMNQTSNIKSLMALTVLSVSVACNTGSKDNQASKEQAKKTQYALNTGLENGLQTEKYPNGNKKFEGNMKDGKRIGEWFMYFEDGTLWSRCNYVNDQKQGKSVVYLPNGSKAYEGMYEKDQPIGEWIYYKEDGSVAKKVNRQ